MNKNDYTIRLEEKKDYPHTEYLVREAFWNVYRPGCLEHYVLHCMRSDPDFIPALSFVLEKDGNIIGQNVFVRAHISSDDGRKIPLAAMGPICIAPPFQRQGWGKLLLDYSLEKAREYGIPALCFEGNIGFYGKSGFVPASRFGIRYHGIPEDMDAPFFLCRELIPGYFTGISGEYTPPTCYFVEESEAEAFDKTFPPKEKRKLPTQIF